MYNKSNGQNYETDDVGRLALLLFTSDCTLYTK